MSFIDDLKKRYQSFMTQVGKVVTPQNDNRSIASRVAAQVNPWDKGATFTQKAQPQQNIKVNVQTARPQAPPSFNGYTAPPKPVTTQTTQLPKQLQGLLDYTVGKSSTQDTRNLASKIYDQLNPVDNNRTFRQATPTNKDNAAKQYAKATFGPLVAVPLAGSRVITGAAQGLSGLYDLATPGTGTNRVSQSLDKVAKDIDKAGAATSNPVYRVATPVGEIGSYAASGGALFGAKVAAAAGKAGNVAKFGKVLNVVDKPAAKVADKFGRVGKMVEGAIISPEAIPEIAGTMKYIGEDASKGEEITPERVAVDVATGVAGNLIGSAGNRWLQKVAKEKIFKNFAEETDPSVISKQIETKITEVPKEDIPAISEQIAKSQDTNEIKDIIAKSVDKGAGTTPKTIEQPTPVIGKEPASIPKTTDDVANGVAQTTNTTHIKTIVDAVFPNADEAAKTDLVSTLAKTKDPEEVKRLLDEAQARQAELTQAVAKETPAPVETQTLDQAVQESPTPVAPQQAPQQALPTETTTPSPAGVADATDATNVPGAEQVDIGPEAMGARATAIKEKNKRTFWEKVGNFVKTNWDPRAEARKVQKLLEKKLGRKLLPSEQIESAINFSSSAGKRSMEYIKNSPLANVIEKYGIGTDGERDFVSYLAYQRDLEIRAEGGQPLLHGTVEDLHRNIADLEAKYPGIREDGLSVTQGYVKQLQEAAAFGDDAYISPEDLQKVRTKKDGTEYQWYAPINRPIPEGQVRPEINANNVGSIANQKLLQARDATGDLDPTFDALGELSDVFHRQQGQARVSRTLANATQEGVGGNRFIITAEQDAAMKQAKITLTNIRDIKKSLDAESSKLKLKTKYAAKDLKNARNQVVVRARQVLRDLIGGSEDGAYAAIKDMSDDDLIDVMKVLAEPDIRKVPNVQRIYNRLVKANSNYAGLIDELKWKKMDAESLSNAEDGLQREIANLEGDPTTGLNVIRGLDANGNRFVIETTPEMATLLKGIDAQQFGKIQKGMQTFQAPFRMAFTGIANPAFQLKQVIWNAAMAPWASKRGFKIYAPSAVKAGFSALNMGSDMQSNLTKWGANRYGSDLHKLATDSAISTIAGNKNLVSKLRWYSPLTKDGFKRSWGAMNELGGKVDQVYRTMAAKAEYDYVLKKTGSVREAEIAAADAYNTVLPDFGNVSNLIKTVDSIIPYTAAGQAGTRTFLRAWKEQPIKNTAMAALYVSPVVGLTAYNYSHSAGEEYYKDMIENGKSYTLDTNTILVLPGAHKDPETGEWNGVIKIPTPPEFRPFNRAIRETFTANEGVKSGVPIGAYARALFDTITGGSITGAKSPGLETVTGLWSGRDPQYGTNIYDPNATRAEKAKQGFGYTLGNLGTVGKAAMATSIGDELIPKYAKEGTSPTKVFVDSFKNILYGGKGSTDTSRFYKHRADSIKEVGLNQNQLDTFNGIISPTSKDLSGENIKDKSFYSSSAKAQAWLNDITGGDGKLWEVSKLLNNKLKADGRPTDPLYDLAGDKLKTVLTMMGNPSPGNPEEKQMAIDNPWLKDFNKKRSEYFDKVFGGAEQKDYTGVTVPKASKETSTKIEGMKALDSAEKARFIRDNPDVTEYFDAQNDYQRYKRAIMGLPQFDRYPEAPKEIQSYMDEYNALPKANGPVSKTTGKPTSPDRSAWIKNNPDKWQQMSDQWYKQTIWNLQGEAALAVYEGSEISQETLDKVAKSVSQQNGTSGYSYGYGKFGYSKSGSGGYTPKEKAPPSDEVGTFLAGIKTGAIEQPSIIPTTPQQKTKFKVTLPKSSKPTRLRLQ